MIRQAVVLAAGKSGRFWPLNRRHKSLIKVMGKPLIFYTVASLQKSGFSEIVIVQNQEKDIQAVLSPLEGDFSIKVKYVVQPEAKGMGNALWQAKDYLEEKFLVLNAERIDVDDIISRHQKQIQSYLGKEKHKGILFGKETESPQLFGVMKLAGDRVLSIVEKPKKRDAPSNIRTVGIYILETDFFETYEKVKKHDYDFESALSEYMKEKSVGLILLDRKKKTPSLKYPWHIFETQNYLFKKYLTRKTESSAKIVKGSSIQGRVYIGKNTRIFKNAIIKGPCYIGDNCIVGDQAIIRDNVNIEENGIVGAKAEITRSNLQDDVHLHSNFIGDSVLDRGCRVGAGTITANVRIDREKIRSLVKGKEVDSNQKSLGVIMGEGTMIGVNCSFMPGIVIGSNCIIGPASFVKEKVIEDNTLFYTEFKATKKKKK